MIQDKVLGDKERPKKGKRSGVGLYIHVYHGWTELVSVLRLDLVGKEPMYCRTQWCRMGVGRKAVEETGGDKTNRILT